METILCKEDKKMDPIRNRIKMAVDTLGRLRYSQRMPVEGVRVCDGTYDFHGSFCVYGCKALWQG